MKKIVLILLCFVLITSNLFSQENSVSATIEGQAIGWTNLNFANDFASQWGGRYIPELSLEYNRNNDWKIDGEFSANAYGVKTYQNENWTGDSDLKPYRSWIRFSNEQFELRAGLQKINFGSANMLRPLMWFDKMDPRDPLGLTDGVNALLARYYFLNNANVWLWALYGNEDPRGWDMLPSNKRIPEMGGRIQLPLFNGEFGITYHHRTIGGDSVSLSNGSSMYFSEEFPQTKIGLDGRWDIGPGIMFEYAMKSNSITENNLYSYENQLTLGIDYTFGIGNGLTTMLEHFSWAGSRDEIFNTTDHFQFTALNMTYPIGMMDNLSAIIYYSWGDESWYRFVNWGRQYDKISLYLMAYWNPDKFNIMPNADNTNLFSGQGFQLMLTYNH
ncbi:MAG: hypothetical protein KAS71_13195 [Bacteroidales bacterium]|nr:hypothetical protein [Bacteroidales bacterium]